MYVIYNYHGAISNVVTEEEVLQRPHCYKELVHASTLLNLNGVKVAFRCYSQELRDRLMMYLEKNNIYYKVCTMDYIQLLECLIPSPAVKGEYRVNLFNKVEKLFDKYCKEKTTRLYANMLYNIMKDNDPSASVRMKPIIDELYRDEPHRTDADIKAGFGQDPLRPEMTEAIEDRKAKIRDPFEQPKEKVPTQTEKPAPSHAPAPLETPGKSSDGTQKITEATEKMSVKPQQTTSTVTITVTVTSDNQDATQNIANKFVKDVIHVINAM